MTVRTRAVATFAGTFLAGLLLVDAKAAAAPSPLKADPALVAALDGAQRSPAFTARDKFRHPLEALAFFGLKPGMTIAEIWPSGGYWTEILAPFAKATSGHYIAVQPDAGRKLPERFANASVYGTISYAAFNKETGPIVASGSVDFVLTSRNIHDWVWTPGFAEKAMTDFYAALKPGGILAVVDHRADPRPMADNGQDGYLSTAYVVALAQKAGFKLESSSEINANPKDTKDHPFGVWTLPPTLTSAPRGQPPNPNFDHSKYKMIGESDRMTLRFRKPG